jgi:ribosome-binding factor A
VAHEFQRELSAVLARGLRDPRVTGLITVTGAKMSPDLKEAVAYVSILGDEKVIAETLAGLHAAAGYLQREVARGVKLRYTPHLRFVFDESVGRGDRIERLLREAKAQDAAAKDPAAKDPERK